MKRVIGYRYRLFSEPAKRKFPELITHCDAVQGFLKVPFQVRSLQADLLSISGHKVHGVKGVGALYQKNGIHLHPTFHGGSQERGLRPGTENVPAIAAFGAAVQTYGSTVRERYQAVTEKKHIYWNDYKNFQTVKFIL